MSGAPNGNFRENICSEDTAVARLGFKRRATALLKSNLIQAIEFGTAVARRLKRALTVEGLDWVDLWFIS